MGYATRLKQGECVMVGAATLTMAEIAGGRASIRVTPADPAAPEALVGPLAANERAIVAGAALTVLSIKGPRARISLDADPAVPIRRPMRD